MAETLFVGTVSMAKMLHVHRYQKKCSIVIRGETIVLNCSPSEAAVEMGLRHLQYQNRPVYSSFPSRDSLRSEICSSDFLLLSPCPQSSSLHVSLI